MTKLKKVTIHILSLIGAATFASGVFVDGFASTLADDVPGGAKAYDSYVNKSNAAVKTNREDFYDENAIYKLPENVSQNDEISVIVTMSTQTVTDAYEKTKGAQSLSEYAVSSAARQISLQAAKERNRLKKKLNDSGVSYVAGEEYDTIVSGFEITVKAKDFKTVDKLLSSEATLIVGEIYAPAETEVVTNEVDVYETGIFDSSSSAYQGDGVLVAVLDTGLDYTHSAFDVANFTTSNEAFTLQTVSEKVGKTTAAGFTPGLTGEDVYINKKIPYAYDYGDKDPDVLPISSEHGTHVAGIIAGKDDTITGVAPNAQLAIMKVFSDTATGAKTSWILSALEDCVTLGVDVINMSLGTSCGFSREVDEERVNDIYDNIRRAGISLIAAASNDYNATFGSDKNGSNGLTSNPDSGTVGAPSTYAAALSVASVDGVKTPYLLYRDQIIYFNEASTSAAKTKDFVDDILKTQGPGVTSRDFEYVTIPGVGRSSDYARESGFYKDKIVLVKRGTTTFEDKVRVALKEKGAAGVIIYNNISGTISMSVGADVGAVCSISQDEGEMLAAAETGIIKISRLQVAGPFMSDFSSWGPTSDLKIKPEITAHGGEILSAVPGQGYDRLSGTSMAAPNQAGATALIRQYVKYSGVFGGDLAPADVTARVNQLMMSTADIVYNKNGLPYAVRKQGAGLVNISKAARSASYITTYDETGAMDKTKLELGDDKKKTGVYEMTFDINNVGDASVAYAIDSLLLTEGVGKTYTSHGDTTVTQNGRLLSGGSTTVTAVSNGSQNGNTVTVAAKSAAKVTVRIVLSGEDKKYMDDSFAYGMYVEGFLTLKATSGTKVDMNVPLLAFYGDWTQAPVFDEEYYDTHADEINAGLDDEDKLMADAYATRVIGGLYSDYIATLGSYYFIQNPAATQIAASKEHIALSNLEDGENSTVNSISSIWAGLLRNVKEVDISIVEDSTGKEIYSATQYNQHKSYTRGLDIYQSPIDVDFRAFEHNLKNNTKYTVTVTSYIDYGTKAEQKNVRNTFEFPLYIDFEAPAVTDVTYRSEYDKSTKKTKLFADLSIYDNHYAMGVQIGQVVPADPASGYAFSMSSFGKYVTPVYSSFNSTSKVTIELTDYVAQLKQSAGFDHASGDIEYNNNSFVAICYDYAMNSATYEIRLPDEILSMYFTEETVRLSPNETLDLSTVMNVYPGASWIQVLDFQSSDGEIADVVNQTIIAKKSGTATITAVGYDGQGNRVTADVSVRVLAPGEEGYQGGYTVPEVNKFTITGYTTNKAYYEVSNSDREIGVTGGRYDFAGNYALSMFPSESVTIEYKLDSYFPKKTEVTYKSGNGKIASVSQDGTIVAQAEGNTIIMVSVRFDGKTTLYSGRIAVTVKDPVITNSIYLTSYKGLGGTVVIPGDRGITTIGSYAFSNYDFVEKDLENGDVIDEEDPYSMKQTYIGEETITKVVLPEGVTDIEAYAFANLTALEEVVLPSTLTKIGVGAFLGCEKLKKINLEKVKFINEKAFSGCSLEELDLNSVVAIGNYTFEGCKLNYVVLPQSSQSLGIGAFYRNDFLMSVEFQAPKIKIGSYAFAECPELSSIDINAAVVSSYAFYNCAKLGRVSLGRDVAVIGEFAFSGTNVAAFTLDSDNSVLSLKNNGALLYKGTELILAAPLYAGVANTVTTDAASIATGAFAGNTRVFRVEADRATTIGAYAFAECSNLKRVSLNNAEEIGEYAFMGTSLAETPDLSRVARIGDYAFADTSVVSVTIPDNARIGRYAFAFCARLESVTLGDGVTVGEAAFYCPVNLYTYEATGDWEKSRSYYKAYTYEVKNALGETVETHTYYAYQYGAGVLSRLRSVAIGGNAVLGDYAFAGNARLETLAFGDGAKIGKYAFFNAAGLKDVDLSGAKEIGDYAFSGSVTPDAVRGSDNVWSYAERVKYVNGRRVVDGLVYTCFAPAFATADLTSAASLGQGAFAGNPALDTVVFGGAIAEIAAYAFADCVSLSQIALPERIVSVGAYAFSDTSLAEADLTHVALVGEYAFSGTRLSGATLKEGAVLGTGAFEYCDSLTGIGNLDRAKTIGAYAFAGTALKEAVLTDAEYLGDYAFGDSLVEKVTFGDKLTALGENPFAGCAVATFGKETEIRFGDDAVETRLTETYDVSKTVKVIDGVLYQIVPKGLELVSYPLNRNGASYAAEEGTVRISAKAFAGASLQNVTLPSTLKALGDQAFYGCANLAVVVFKSYEAPILEEAYNASYSTDENFPFTGSLGDYKGLGISPFYMWNPNPVNFYFGANFVDHIGHLSEKLVMVRPANGRNYDTFIFSQYFGTTVSGSNAALEVTLKVIQMIDALPDQITLASEEAVVAARSAYEKLPSIEQQALVSNYSALTDAESTIAYLKTKDPIVQPPEPPVKEPSKFVTFLKEHYVSLIIAGASVLTLAAYVTVTQILRKKNKAGKN